MFTEKTPRQIIEGYTDPLVASLTQMPVFAGGDITQDPFLSLTFSPTNPKDNKMAFLGGSGSDKYDYLFTRLYAKWLDRTDVRIRI